MEEDLLPGLRTSNMLDVQPELHKSSTSKVFHGAYHRSATQQSTVSSSQVDHFDSSTEPLGPPRCFTVPPPRGARPTM